MVNSLPKKKSNSSSEEISQPEALNGNEGYGAQVSRWYQPEQKDRTNDITRESMAFRGTPEGYYINNASSKHIPQTVDEGRSRSQAGNDLDRTDINISSTEEANASSSKRNAVAIGSSRNSSRDVSRPIQSSFDPRSIPISGPWVQATFDMGTGRLTVSKYYNGRLVKTVDIKPGGPGSSNWGAFSGRGQYRNESESAGVKNGGAIPLGNYYIYGDTKNAPIGYREGSYAAHYRVSGGWYRLERMDENIGDDATYVNGVRRDRIRLHIGNDSIGCVTVKPDNVEQWREVEGILGVNGDRNTTLGTMTVVDSRRGPGNWYTGSNKSSSFTTVDAASFTEKPNQNTSRQQNQNTL
jgi:Protein of unknown function (DUF2778)